MLLHRLVPRVVHLTNLIWMSKVGLVAVLSLYTINQIKFAQLNHDLCAVPSTSKPRLVIPEKADYLADKCFFSGNDASAFDLVADLGFSQVNNYVQELYTNTEAYLAMKDTEDVSAI
jgi:hypothetical protein